MWEKVRGVFLMPSNGKNVTNFFPYLIKEKNVIIDSYQNNFGFI